MKMKKEELKKLESRKNEIVAEIKKYAKGIQAERDALADKIFSLEKERERTKGNPSATAPSKNIYDEKSIVEAAEKIDDEQTARRIKFMYKAYAINPFADAGKSEKIMPLLDELETICKKIDTYYKEELAEASNNLKKAQENYREVVARRKLYRGEVLEVQKSIHDTVVYGKIGNNELRRHGANPITATSIFSLASINISGEEIVDIVKSAIDFEVKRGNK